MAETGDGLDPAVMQQMQQMEQMQAMLQMAGGMGGIPGPLPTPQAPDMSAYSTLTPQVDPAMAAAYTQMFQYLQQGLAQPPPQMPPVAPPLPGMPAVSGFGGPSAQPQEPSVSVSVEGMKFQYQLTEDDLHKVFSRYGSVKGIKVDEAGASSVITFHSFQDAQAAMTDLNGKVLNGLDGTLRLAWVSSQSPVPPPYPFSGWGFPANASSLPGLPAAWPPPAQAGAGGDATSPSADREKLPPHNKGVRKYTCRFIIGIENDEEFQVARKIIGSKGSNMKRIVKNTEAKLRLRGQGSGYFEGASKTESPEPLQLCISCVSFDGYKTAVKQTEALLKGVYDEYRHFCKDNGRPIPENLGISLSENQLVYSSKEFPHGAGGDDDAVSPDKKDSRRVRRSRAKRDSKTASGEIDRGEPGPTAPPVEEIEKLIDERNEARRGTNWGEADRIRQLLHSKGVALMDEPGGRGRGTEVTTWRYWRD